METVPQILWNGDAIVRNSCLEIPQFLSKICDALCIGESPGSRALQLPTKGGTQVSGCIKTTRQALQKT